LKRQYGEKTLSNVTVYKWSSAFKKGRVENEPHGRRPRTSVIGENSNRVDALIRDKRRITDRGFSGILNISDGSVKRIKKTPSILERNMRNKRKRAQTSVSFLQDNARPHVASRTMDTIQKLKWNFLPHPPYSPDLAP